MGFELPELNDKEQAMRMKVCLPLDNIESMDHARERVEELSPVVGLFKVGYGSFTKFGPEIIRMVQGYGANVFLDLKYHDIPNTVNDAAFGAAMHGVYMFNVHASGGLDMMKAAMEGAADGSAKYGTTMPKVIGVTVLTSLDEAKYLETFAPVNPALDGIDFRGYVEGKDEEQVQDAFRTLLQENTLEGVVERQVRHLALLTKQAGLDGIVCSAKDLRAITDYLPDGFVYATPGVKGPNVEAGKDQARVATPYNAVQDGSSVLVIGRAITGGKTPEERLQRGYAVLQDMSRAA